jgi:hypothetical protein
MRKINHQKAQRRAMIYMLGISAAVLAMSYLGKTERDRLDAIDAANEEALRVAMVPDGYHPGASVEFELSLELSDGESVAVDDLQDWFDGEWDPQVVSDCMIAWWLVDPQISGEISMEVIYGPSGPQTLRVSEFSELPYTASSCLVTAIDGIDWPVGDQGSVVSFTLSTQLEVVSPNMAHLPARGSVLETVESQ